MKNKNVWKAFDGIVQQLETCLGSPKGSIGKNETTSKKNDAQQTTEKSPKKIGKKGKAIKR